jgi:hypothetical protein
LFKQLNSNCYTNVDHWTADLNDLMILLIIKKQRNQRNQKNQRSKISGQKSTKSLNHLNQWYYISTHEKIDNADTICRGEHVFYA